MHVMSKYCKAYPVSRLREFEGWNENAHGLKTKKTENGEEIERGFDDGDILFLQEDFTVTSGIFMDEDVVFNHLTPDWTDYCKEKLNFQVPELG